MHYNNLNLNYVRSRLLFTKIIAIVCMLFGIRIPTVEAVVSKLFLFL